MTNDMKRQNWINVLFSILIIISLLFSFLKVTPFALEGDTYIGIIVTLLSMATTFVIGYQIYNAIEPHKEIKEQRNMYNNILRKNHEQEEIILQQQATMQGGFDIISALIKYNSKESEIGKYIDSFCAMHHALINSLKIKRQDYSLIFYYMKRCIILMNTQDIVGTVSRNKKDKFFYITTPGDNWGRKFADVVNEYRANIHKDEVIIRQSEFFWTIQSRYDKIMKYFEDRLNELINDPLNIKAGIVSPQKEESIMNS